MTGWSSLIPSQGSITHTPHQRSVYRRSVSITLCWHTIKGTRRRQIVIPNVYSKESSTVVLSHENMRRVGLRVDYDEGRISPIYLHGTRYFQVRSVSTEKRARKTDLRIQTKFRIQVESHYLFPRHRYKPQTTRKRPFLWHRMIHHHVPKRQENEQTEQKYLRIRLLRTRKPKTIVQTDFPPPLTSHC